MIIRFPIKHSKINKDEMKIPNGDKKYFLKIRNMKGELENTEIDESKTIQEEDKSKILIH